jgi:methionyl-tRNA formyltransferase
MSFSKILIISDNAFLSSEFKNIIKVLPNKKNYTFDFAKSPNSQLKDPRKKAKIYDLKKNENITEIIKNYDLVFSIHCKQFFPNELVKNVKCINIHPGYNPINRGWFPQIFAIIHNLPIGATIHEIDSKLDHGSIIARQLIEKYDHDTSYSLYQRILKAEIKLLKRYLPEILENKYSVTRPENEGNLFLKKDFNELLKIDLDQKYSAAELIDRLRALTHDEYNNAYFIDRKTGKKIFIGIILKKES